jgi:hypothetical protein
MLNLPKNLDLNMLKNDAMGRMYDYQNRSYFGDRSHCIRRLAAITVLYRCLESACADVYSNQTLEDVLYEEEREHPQVTKLALEELEDLLEGYW